MIWALSGHHPTIYSNLQYDFRIGTQVAPLGGVAASSIRDAMLQIRRRLTLGIWWGHSDLLYSSATWEPLTPAALNPFSTADAAEAFVSLQPNAKPPLFGEYRR